jgi:hypothetical protein
MTYENDSGLFETPSSLMRVSIPYGKKKGEEKKKVIIHFKYTQDPKPRV